MSSPQKGAVSIHYTDNLTEKVEAVYDRITKRAYERWLNRRAAGESIVAFWSAAERELIFVPATEIREWGHGVTVRITCTQVDPAKIRLFLSSKELLALAPLNEGQSDRWLFRYVGFQKPIDTSDVSAQFEGCMLHIAATLQDAPEEHKIRFQVA